jgi:hypothetical protein
LQGGSALRVPSLGSQYPFAVTDKESGLRNRDFNVTVAWNVMPHVGAMHTNHRTFTGGCFFLF